MHNSHIAPKNVVDNGMASSSDKKGNITAATSPTSPIPLALADLGYGVEAPPPP
jgi:hypothetical protein